jgi:hypothetical protein
MKLVVSLAIVFGIVVGTALALVQSIRSPEASQSSSAAVSEEIDPRKNLSSEVLKALPDDELAEIFPEKADAILNPEFSSQIRTEGKDSDDPEYLRAVLLKMGANPPADATTSELREMLADVSEEVIFPGK